MKTTKVLLVLFFLAAGTAFAQKGDREKIYKTIDAVMASKSYEHALQYVDVINGWCINTQGGVRFIDEAFKNRRVYVDKDVSMVMPSFDECLIVLEGNVAMVSCNTRLKHRVTEETEGWENALLLRKEKGKDWKVARWVQVQTTKPIRGERKEFR